MLFEQLEFVGHIFVKNLTYLVLPDFPNPIYKILLWRTPMYKKLVQ